jgi:hypothetical protein
MLGCVKDLKEVLVSLDAILMNVLYLGASNS